MSRAEPIRCPYCRERHMPRYLCDPAKAFLDATVARGDSYSMPTLEFEQPVRDPAVGQPGDQLLRQVVIKGAVVPAGTVHHPALMFTGQTLTKRLPHWVFAGSDEQLRAIAKLAHDMAELAIRRADEANQEGTPS